MLEPLELSDMSQPQVSTAAAMETANSSSKKAVAAGGGIGSSSGDKAPSKSLKSGQLQEHSMDSSREILAVPALLGANNSSHTNSKNAEPTMQNGKLLTTVYPSNSHCAWLIPPRYDSKSMPNILLAKGVALPAQTFTEIITRISSDLRFFSYAVLHSRITPLWLIFSIIILLVVLASSPSGGFPIMVFALVWLLMLVFGLIMCLLIRKYIVLSLRNLMREVNKVALQHRILVGIQDNGHLSCQKVAIMMVYYNTAGCREDLAKLLRIHRANPNLFSPSAAQPSHQPSPTAAVVDQQQLVDEANELLCLYSQAYAKAYMKKRFLFPTRPAEGVSDFRPKHCQKSICLCQYVEREHFEQKAARKAAPWYERAFAV